MFYSHEILTSREGGLATVWLLATLGSKSVSKKVNKKAIQDVNVPKTCDIIIHPEAPMALRLQSNLLYGVSRVFSQQSGFVLSDAQIMQTNMRALLKAVRTSNLDPDAGKARRDQITIEDDSAFIPDLTFEIDLLALDMSTTESSRRSSLLSPHTLRSSLSSQLEDSMTGLIIPSSSGGGGDIGGFQLPSEQGSSIQRQQRINRLLEDDGEAFDIDPGFSIDADGNLVEGPAAADETLPRARVRTPEDRGILPPSSEVRVGTQGAQDDPGLMDFAFDDQVQFQDEGALLPQAEPFPKGAQQQGSSSQAAEDDESESAEAAMHRRRRHRPVRRARALPFDEVQELRSGDLTGWQADYVANMAEAQQSREQHRAPSLAKKKAFDWVLGSGIGGVGDAFPSLPEKNLLNMFTGDSVLEMITGVRPSAGRKRGRDEESAGGTDSETRRKRVQDEENGEIGRGDMPPFQDDDIGFQASDDIELGRHGATPLIDDPTFPWNTTASALASRHGSSIARRGGGDQPLGFPPSSSVAAGRSHPASSLRLGSLDRRASRIASSSPLRGRGGDFRSGGSPAHLPSDEPYQGFGNDEDDDYEDADEAQQQASSQLLLLTTMTMSQEAVNFLDFVRARIEALSAAEADEPAGREEEEEEGGRRSKMRVEFEQLLPPGEHSVVVAAQGLHHVLALATKNLVEVEQREAFGAIRIGIRG